MLQDDKKVQGPALDRGLVFREPRLFPWLTFAENMALETSSLGRSKRKQAVAERFTQVALAGRKRPRDSSTVSDLPSRNRIPTSVRVALIAAVASVAGSGAMPMTSS
ncbi:MAG TPA: hypothetical protein VMA37_17560 [Acetobacteraceae bacterium]|nr:hypothetical protein [Acetobacteraceae bacterium]